MMEVEYAGRLGLYVRNESKERYRVMAWNVSAAASNPVDAMAEEMGPCSEASWSPKHLRIEEIIPSVFRLSCSRRPDLSYPSFFLMASSRSPSRLE